jgi:hypothetical protein
MSRPSFVRRHWRGLAVTFGALLALGLFVPRTEPAAPAMAPPALAPVTPAPALTWTPPTTPTPGPTVTPSPEPAADLDDDVNLPDGALTGGYCARKWWC